MDREDAERLVVTKAHFDYAVEYDVKPAFGISENELDNYVKNGW